MKVLIFDTETTGLPTERNASILETKKWPHIVQLSYILYDTKTKTVISCSDNIIKINDEVIISEDSIAIHHITRDLVKEKGICILEAIDRFNECLLKCDIVVGHNISFDKRMMMVECIRNKKPQYFTTKGIRKSEYCTMKNSIEICKIPVINKDGEQYFKYPKLSELHNHLFNSIPEGLHNAMADVLICLRCYVFIEHKYDISVDSCDILTDMYAIYCLPE
jgi:DNA polymerase III epsilon subunit-like protein